MKVLAVIFGFLSGFFGGIFKAFGSKPRKRHYKLK